MMTKRYNRDLDAQQPLGPNNEVVMALAERLGLSAWAVSQQSAAATALTATRAAEANKIHSIQGFEVAIEGADTTVAITVVLRIGSTVVWRTASSPSAARGTRISQMFTEALSAPANTAVSLEVSAGSVGVITDGNLAGLTRTEVL